MVVAGVVASVAAGGAIQAQGAGKVLKPPVIHESFTPLPCPDDPQSTLEQEGCAEAEILRTDKKIDDVVSDIFATLADDPARKRLIKAQKTWLKFRRADCASRSDIFEGGSQAAVIFAGCSADHNHKRLKELKQFRSDLTSER
ncbi:MAG: hypothetical protein QOF76_4599 [Solirubrobacteraceae bacterium]|jgi:uncharacterized protein YecT (DUF1311 family)|nr:hypothetical protein [Solirubrobacteraceae bacterium]